LPSIGVRVKTVLTQASGVGRILSSEILIMTPAIENLIREGKTEQIPMLMQTGGKHRMQTMNQSLAELVTKRKITQKEALETSSDKEELTRLLAQRMGTPGRV
jgi:twitching motility protein PilT